MTATLLRPESLYLNNNNLSINIKQYFKLFVIFFQVFQQSISPKGVFPYHFKSSSKYPKLGSFTLVNKQENCGPLYNPAQNKKPRILKHKKKISSAISLNMPFQSN